MKRVLFAILAGFALFLYASSHAEELTLTFGGDCVLGTREEWKKQPDTFDGVVKEQGLAYCFENLQPIFKADDLTMINLECVFQSNNKGHNYKKQHTFRGEPEYAEMLALAGVEKVNLANNHTIDYRTAGMRSTRAALDAAGIFYSGNQELYIWEKDGLKIGFGGCRETSFADNKAIVYRDIQKLKKRGCDVIVYSCHWGKEYAPTRSAMQERMAQYAVNSGADIVVGTHPHVVQGIESRQSSDGSHSAVVLYSLGNLVFGGTHEMKTFDAMLAQAVLRFDEQGVYLGVEIRPIPVLTSGAAPENNFQPVLAHGADAERIMGLAQADSEMTLEETMWFSRSGTQ